MGVVGMIKFGGLCRRYDVGRQPDRLAAKPEKGSEFTFACFRTWLTSNPNSDGDSKPRWGPQDQLATG
jgi:hypothetical protein